MQTKLFLFTSLCFSFGWPAVAQVGSPVPGTYTTAPSDSVMMAPVPGAELRPANVPDAPQRITAPGATAIAPVPKPGRSAYGQLPLTVKDAKNRLVELRNALAVTSPHNLRDPIFQLSEWLGDTAEAHNKMAAAFSKYDTMKSQAAAEKQVGTKFGQLRYDAQLLKADLLIAEKRYPEALAPLVEIVLAVPTSTTGIAAYQRLKDLGFSQDAAGSAPTAAASIAPSLASSTVVSAKQLPKTEARAQVKQKVRTPAKSGFQSGGRRKAR